ncbi:zinc-dependent alcohol dehydrogenase family protein [Paenibacillus dakarensis]|uniref:zinc-dependent alcohol dehydrogenase family protein n=1 Tax=Paenibacillus dakarensis TaxID=1527293 RepID=UPI00147889FF|nr:zinc-dependent alcohol dehydrogenase family protein [Paenibacillus dakarensis]
MKALVIEAPFQASIKEVPYPAPGKGEVTIEVERAGICGTDIHIFKGEFLSSYPIIPGHEFSGVIHEIGEGVTGFAAGDRVTAEPNIFCGQCPFCLTNRGNHCDQWQATGVTQNGAMAEYVTVPAQNVFRIHDSMSFGVAAFIEPMACVVYAMNRLKLKVGDRTLLFGAGAMGQQLIQSLVHAGASELVVVDLSPEKLQIAKQWGATKTVLSHEIDEHLSTVHYPRGFDVVIDATGIPAVIEQAFRYLGPTGKYLQFGVTAQDSKISLSPFDLYQKDWTLIGSMAINHTFYPALNWVKENRVRLDHLITSVLTLDEVPAFLAEGANSNQLKIQVQIA